MSLFFNYYVEIAFLVILAYMRHVLVCLLLLVSVTTHAQTEDEFLPDIKSMVIDSTEAAVQRFCKELLAVTPGYKFAFVDREDVMLSKYMYDNKNFETLKFDFQFEIKESEADSTGLVRKNRVVRLINITAELSTMTKIYNYLFSESHTPDKIIAISAYNKAVNYKGATYDTRLQADDFKAGYWILSFYSL